MLEEFHAFALALILGLLIGVEREYQERGVHKTLGVRTFAFVALIGSLAAWLNTPLFAAAIALSVFALILLGYWRSTSHSRNDPGITTEMAAFATFIMGYILVGNRRLGIAVGLTTLTLLISRGWLHRFVREKLRKQELTAAAFLVILFFGVAPFLPDRTIDPLGIFNPRKLLMLFALIAFLQFLGYALNRLFGERSGLALSGFLGGIVSSTAVFAALPQTRRDNPQQDALVLAHALFSVTGTLAELALVLALASAELSRLLALPLLAMISSSAGLALWLSLTETKEKKKTNLPLRDPVNFLSVLKLAIIVGALIATVNVVHRLFDKQGLWLVAGISGLFELQGVSLAIALDMTRGAIAPTASATAVLAAVAASFVSKWAFIVLSHRDRFGVKLALSLFVVLAAGLVAALWLFGFTNL